MHFDHHLAEVQSDARPLYMKCTRRATLIETVENLPHITLDSHTIVHDLQHSRIIVSLVDANLDDTTVIGIFKSVRQ